MIFLFILIFGVLFLFFNIRQIAPGNKGSLTAGAIVVALPLCFFFREHLWACIGQDFLSVWLCQSLLIYSFWWLLRGILLAVRRRRLERERSIYAARILLAATFAFTALICVVGYRNHEDYKIYELHLELPQKSLQATTESEAGIASDTAAENPSQTSVEIPPQASADTAADALTQSQLTSAEISSQNLFQDSAQFNSDTLLQLQSPVTILFFSDLHIDAVFDRNKLERMIYDADSLHPDYIVFGGDLADIHDSLLYRDGYDTLITQLGRAARKGAVAVNGNHEGYMERSGSAPGKFLKRTGWKYLDDEIYCDSLICFTGRTDHQVARTRGVERVALASISPDSLQDNPWILVDHEPKGIEPEYSGRLPDLALSGHTHKGQFFPGTVVIDWVWRLAYGFGELDGVKWLVSSGVGSWGPPVRLGSETEMWLITLE